MNTIPKKLHFIWIGSDLPPYAEKNIALWSAQPGVEANVWDAAMIRALDPGESDKRMEDSRARRFYTNWARLKILQAEGGVYIDCDMTPLVPDVFAWFPWDGFDWVAARHPELKLVDSCFLACPQGGASATKLLETVSPTAVWAPAHTSFLLKLEGNIAVLDGKVWNSFDFGDRARVFHSTGMGRFGMPEDDFAIVSARAAGKKLLEIGSGPSTLRYERMGTLAGFTSIEFDAKWHQYYSLLAEHPERILLRNGPIHSRISSIAENTAAHDVVVVDSGEYRTEVLQIVCDVARPGTTVFLHDSKRWQPDAPLLAALGVGLVEDHRTARGLLELVKLPPS